jgi:MYXO-CTERM domain-containing protein
MFAQPASAFRLTATLTAVVGLICQPALAAPTTVVLTASSDNTIWSDGGNLSNGAGALLYAGKTLRSGELRRALLRFPIAGSVPPGAVVQSVRVRLYMDRRSETFAFAMSLHRALGEWGEGTSNAGDPGGYGADATSGDVTWTRRFWGQATSAWTVPGGDFAAASAAVPVGDVGQYTWGSTPGLVADVQGWVNTPSSNFGWLLRGDESTGGSAKRFLARESSYTTLRPQLEITYLPAVAEGRETEVPLPAWALGMLGLGLAGAIARRSRQARGPSTDGGGRP